MTDAEMVRQARNGDMEALTALITAYSNAVYGVAYSKLMDFHLAQDVAQEVFIKAFTSLDKLKEPAKVGSWFYSITTNTCFDLMRSNRAWYPTDQIPAEFHFDETQVEVQQALGNLPESVQLPVVLRYLNGYSTREIASFLSITPKAVENRLRRARSILRQELLEMVGDSLNSKKLDENFTEKIKGVVAQFWELYRVGKNEDALTRIKEAVDMRPDDNELRSNLAHIFGVTGRTQEAETEYLKLVEKDPNYYFNLGCMYKGTGEITKAVDCFRKAMSKPTQYQYAAFELAKTYEEMGEYDDAINLSQATASTSIQSFFSAMQTLLKVAQKSGDKERAIWYIRTIVGTMDALGPASTTIFAGYSVYLSMAEALTEYGNYEEAVSALINARDAARCSMKDEVSPLVDKAPIFRGSAEEIDAENNEFTGYFKCLSSDKFNSLKKFDGYRRLVAETKEEVDGLLRRVN